MGNATTRTLDRAAAALWMLARRPSNSKRRMCPGKVDYRRRWLKGCCASPDVSPPDGFYGIDTIFLLLAFMAPAHSVRGTLRRQLGSGKVPGLIASRVDATKKLQLCAGIWSGDDGMPNWQGSPGRTDSELYFYCDGHVRVYHGNQTACRHHVARERLCLRATTITGSMRWTAAVSVHQQGSRPRPDRHVCRM
jgi:hypothetical protein